MNSKFKMITNICNRIIEYSFYLLLFLVPLILTPLNYELFEYNKMMVTYALTLLVAGAWVTKMITNWRFEIRRTPLDFPLLIFLASQIVSYLLSLDRHVSLWGYYSRFHGGLASTFSYLLLYWSFATNLDKQKILNGLRLSLLGGFVVASYGIAEHFGIDDQFWVQDVRNRIFSTLGQPNWLAAYLSILIPITIALSFQKIQNTQKTSESEYQNIRKYFPYFFLALLFYLALLYTKSRSGFLGFWVGNLFFWGILFYQLRKKILRWLLIFNISFLILNFLIGSPFEQINRYFSFTTSPPSGLAEPDPAPQGGTESGEIRKIVWKGAIEIFKHYPVFGSGVETFAFSYYQFRPTEHNLVSEWDFLYNKAHNEYLNFLATTGAFGLGSYLLLISWFIVWNLKSIIYDLRFKNNKSSIINHKYYLILALVSAYISILVSNFFGFSVVVVALFFFLIPLFSFFLTESLSPGYLSSPSAPRQLTTSQRFLTLSTLLVVAYGLFSLFRLWWADVSFARGYNLSRLEASVEAYDFLKQAAAANPNEPLYHDELSSIASVLAIQAMEEKDATQTAYLTKEAIWENQRALEISPRNVNFWKTRTRVFYTLSPLNDDYDQEALEAIQVAHQLAPTDAKISYNLAVLYGRVGKNKEALETLQETVALKPDYRDARYGLALYLKNEGKMKEAVQELEYILEKISPEDNEMKETLKSWREK